MRKILFGSAVALWAGASHASDALSFAPVEPWVAKAVVAAPAAPSGDNQKPVRIVLTDFQINFTSSGTEIYRETAIEPLTSDGLQAGGVNLMWKPDTQTVTVHFVHILRAGQVIDVLANGQTFTVLRREQNLERAMLDGVLTATLQPEGLQVGDVLDVAYTVKEDDPVLKGHSEAFTAMTTPLAIDRARERVLWPASKSVRWRQTPGLDPAVLRKTPTGQELVIDQKDVLRPQPPKGAPQRYSYLDVVEASDFASWNEVSSLLAPLFENASRLSANSPLKAEAAKIKAASSDPKVEAAAALHLVQDRVRYLFLGMNDGGYVPASADLTWSRRFGDCKGKTVVLLALLHELGLDAEPAVVSTAAGDGLDEQLPMTELFDHVIVRLRINGATYWLDGTRTGDRTLDDVRTPPFHWALPLEDKGAALERLEPRPTEAPEAETIIHLDASAGLDAIAPAELTVVLGGDAGAAMRAAYAAAPKADADKALRAIWQRYDWIEIKDVKATFDEASGTERLTMTGAASMSWYLDQASGADAYEADYSRLGGTLDYKRDPGPYQDAPYAVGYPSIVKGEETIILPRGGQGFSISGDPVDTTVGGVSYKRTAALTNGVFTMTTTTQAVAPEFPAADAPAVATALEALSNSPLTIHAPKDFKSGGQELQIRLNRTPTVASEYQDRALARAQKGDYAGAVQDQDQALTLKPNDAILLNSRCFIRAQFGKDLDKALSDCDAALAAEPHTAAVLDSRGFVYFRQGQIDKAMADYNAALAIDPKIAPTLYVKGLIERRQGHKRAGDADVKAATAIDPTVVATYAGYGVKS